STPIRPTARAPTSFTRANIRTRSTISGIWCATKPSAPRKSATDEQRCRIRSTSGAAGRTARREAAAEQRQFRHPLSAARAARDLVGDRAAGSYRRSKRAAAALGGGEGLGWAAD